MYILTLSLKRFNSGYHQHKLAYETNSVIDGISRDKPGLEEERHL